MRSPIAPSAGPAHSLSFCSASAASLRTSRSGSVVAARASAGPMRFSTSLRQALDFASAVASPGERPTPPSAAAADLRTSCSCGGHSRAIIASTAGAAPAS